MAIVCIETGRSPERCIVLCKNHRNERAIAGLLIEQPGLQVRSTKMPVDVDFLTSFSAVQCYAPLKLAPTRARRDIIASNVGPQRLWIRAWTPHDLQVEKGIARDINFEPISPRTNWFHSCAKVVLTDFLAG